MAQYFQQGQRAPAPLLLPSKGELEQPYLQHQAAMQRISADKAIAALSEQGANQRQQASIGSALQLAQMNNATTQEYNKAQIAIQQQQNKRAEQQLDFDINKYITDYEKEEAENLRQQQLSQLISNGLNSGNASQAIDAAFKINPGQGVSLVNAISAMQMSQAKMDENAKEIVPLIIGNITDQKSLDASRNALSRYNINLDPDYNKAKFQLAGYRLAMNEPWQKQEAEAVKEGLKESREKKLELVGTINNVQRLRDIGKRAQDLGIMGPGIEKAGKRFYGSLSGSESAQVQKEMENAIMPMTLALTKSLTPVTETDVKMIQDSLANISWEANSYNRTIDLLEAKAKLEDEYYELRRESYTTYGNTQQFERSPEYQDWEKRYRNLYKDTAAALAAAPKKSPNEIQTSATEQQIRSRLQEIQAEKRRRGI